MKTVEAKNRDEWRAWLADHHDQETEIWLVYTKKGTGLPSVAYGESVEEALCFGWVDSLIKGIDEQRYARKFTPRKDDSNWSPSNKKRVEKMIAAERMTAVGLQKVEAGKAGGKWDTPEPPPQPTYAMHPEFATALERNGAAKAAYGKLSRAHQKEYLVWIEMAKRDATRTRRIDQAIDMLEEGRRLGLK